MGLGSDKDDIIYMREAIALAREAGDCGEVPVGCVIVREGEILSRGKNARERGKSALCHAEIMAIDGACRALGGWRLTDCTLYVTLEPCPMCAGAIINARIKRVVFGAKDAAAGALGSVLDMRSYPTGPRPEVTSGVLADECAGLLRGFFAKRRAEE